MFSEYDNVEAISAGTNKDCEQPVTGDLIEWCDVVLVMEKAHRNKVSRKFRELLKDKKLAVLDIADNYDFMDSALVSLLEAKVPRYVHL